MSKALYRKYRSKTLDEVVGQKHVTDILSRSLKQGRISHAYLLTGPRGIGKTSIARILAHEINGLPYDEEHTHLDIIEIDAASNNSIEDVRDLRDKVQIAPVSANKKIYIIDEVHMLSKAAFNALLKTLEEPPEHVVFILATTDIDKLPVTIVSRTQRFGLHAITAHDATEHLKHIATEEKMKISDAALELIVAHGDGSFRDSISLLDQLSSLADGSDGITGELVQHILGLAPEATVQNLLNAYDNKDLGQIVSALDDSEQAGIEPRTLGTQLIRTVRKLIVQKPQYIALLDDLLTVNSSSQPRIKLLTILAAHAVPKPKTVALSAPSPTVSAPLIELAKQATRKKPEMEPVSSMQTAAPSHSTKKPQEVMVDGESHVTLIINAAKDMAEFKSTKNVKLPVDFDWQSLINETRTHFVAVYSVLSKCDYEYDGQTLTIYTKSKFYKTKLDDTKHRINLMTSLETIGMNNITIETNSAAAPPKDSQAAAVAAIMGGGEEVVVESDAS
ncbi:MAG: DNA polymerase III subunit gamma/tau [Candidatus Saccharimonadales bacterium]